MASLVIAALPVDKAAAIFVAVTRISPMRPAQTACADELLDLEVCTFIASATAEAWRSMQLKIPSAPEGSVELLEQSVAWQWPEWRTR
jgi:hypothetical protein